MSQENNIESSTVRAMLWPILTAWMSNSEHKYFVLVTKTKEYK